MNHEAANPTVPTSSHEPVVSLAMATELTHCWKERGIYGDFTCAELPKFVHCRNCPVYSEAALQLLNRPLPAEYRREWTNHFAQEKRKTEPGNISALLFRIEAEWLALATDLFQEVTERRPIHSLPHRREGTLLGLANVRGELILCISLGHLLGLRAQSPAQNLRTNYKRLLVANWRGSRFGFPAHEVQGTWRFNLQQLHPPPTTLAKPALSFTRGILPWQGRAVGFLDADEVFSTLNQCLS